MATKKQLIDRWKTEPWNRVNQQIENWIIEQASKEWCNSNIKEIFLLLEGLPYRDELENGKDLRGSAFSGAMKIDLRKIDFSYCPNIYGFDNCNLTNSRLDYISGNVERLQGQFKNVSFIGSKLSKTWMSHSKFINCDFSKANLNNAKMHQSVFRSCNFQGAKLNNADLQNSDIRGCNFNEADLSYVMFRGIKLNKTTNLIGANLSNIIDEDQFDFNGKIVIRGTNYREATFNKTTIYMKDEEGFERNFELNYLEAIIENAKQFKKPWISDFIQKVEILQLNFQNDNHFNYVDELEKMTEGPHGDDINDILKYAAQDIE
jgi:uncharacterized protein YjbI with pentapeptide repeats